MNRTGQQSYHHGDLRAALVTIALGILESAGPEQLSLRTLASAAGVSRTAPYAHFRDKRALLGAIAQAGFDRLEQGMLRTSQQGSGAREAFLAIGRAYVCFALENPNLFKLMFSAELGQPKTMSAPQAGSDGAYGVFRRGLEAFLREGRAGLADADLLAVSAWSLVHGLSLLLLEERLAVPEANREALAASVTALFADLVESRAGG